MSNFDRIVEEVLKKEGLYSNHVDDTGGATKYGITESVARQHGYKGNMRYLTLEFAKSIYKKSYWDSIKLDQVKNFDIQKEMFDTAVNCGTKMAVKFMQRAYNLLNTNNLLVDDGIIGPATLKAINSYTKPNRLYILANAYQCKYYIDITEGRSQNKSFIFGWLDKRVDFMK